MLASSGNELKLWDLSTPDQLYLVKEYQPVLSGSNRLTGNSPVLWFSVRHDYGQIASIIKGDSINLINTVTHEQDYLRESNEDVTCCCYDSTGRYLAAGTSNGSLDIFDFNSTIAKRRSWKVNTPISCISWSKSDRYIATGSTNGTVTLFNKVMHVFSNPPINITQNGGRQNGTNTQNPSITSIQYSAINSSNIGCTYDDGTVLVWDTSKEKLHSSFKSHTLPCTSFTFSPINNILMVSGGLDGLCCYDLYSKKTIKTIPCPGGVSSLDMHTNGTNVCVGTASGHLKVFDLRNLHGTPVFSQLIHDTSVHCIKYLHTNNIKSNDIQNENITTNRPSAVVHHGSQQNNLNFTPDSHLRIANSSSIKKSSSFDHQHQLTALSNNTIGGQHFNIFSPEIGGSHPYQSSLSSLNSNQSSAPFHSTATGHMNDTNGNGRLNEDPSSFILHKKNTSVQSNGQISANGSTKMELGTPTFTTDAKQARMNKLRNDMFSPLNNSQSPTSSINNNTLVPMEVPSTSLIAQFAQNKKINEGKRISPSSSFSNTSSINLKNPVSPKSSLSGMSQPSQSQTNPMNTQSSSSTSSQPTAEQTSPNLPMTNGLLNGHHSNSSSHLAACANINQTSMLPMKQLEEAIKDKIDDFRDELMSENFRFKAEMLKEFMDLKIQIQKSLEACSLNDELLKEIVKLREENKRLKKLF